MNSSAKTPIRWFPRLRIGTAAPAPARVETLVSVSWLLMTELHAYLEDVSGAPADEDVQQSLALRLAELAVALDLRLRGDQEMDELHHLPLLLEFGLTEVAQLAGDEVVEALSLAAAQAPDRAAHLTRTYESMLAGFPARLFNPLLPETQGQVLRTLRTWNRLCSTAGTDPAFLAPLMRSL
jgi:hypothetical protein